MRALIFLGSVLLLVCIPLQTGAADITLAGSKVIPAVFVIHCAADPTVQECEPNPVYGGPFLEHLTHTWFQLVNTSGHTFGGPSPGPAADAEYLRLYLYGKDGRPAEMDAACAGEHHYDAELGYIDLLAHADGALDPGEAVFLYLNYCMFDNRAGTTPDANPPFYAEVEGRAVMTGSRISRGAKKLELDFNTGAEEGVVRGDGRYSSSAVTVMTDKLSLHRSRR